MFGSVLLLVVLGVLMVFSASAVMASEKFGSPYHFLFRQLGWAVAGLAAMSVAMTVDYRRWKKPAIVFTLLGVTAVLLVAVFFLDRSHNTHRWIKLGGFMSFQPSELAKPALILFLAFFLEARTKSMDDWRHTLLPAVIPAFLFAALIMKQPDLGTALVCLGVTAAILYTAGVGLMEGKQKLFYLPEPHTDFIYAVTAEELGLIGAVLIATLFFIFAWRGLRTSLRARDAFGRYIAVGVTTMIVVQAFFNISVVLALLPTKGIPLPFISYGGSSLFVMLASVGVLLNVSQQTEEGGRVSRRSQELLT